MEGIGYCVYVDFGQTFLWYLTKPADLGACWSRRSCPWACAFWTCPSSSSRWVSPGSGWGAGWGGWVLARTRPAPTGPAAARAAAGTLRGTFAPGPLVLVPPHDTVAPGEEKNGQQDKKNEAISSIGRSRSHERIVWILFYPLSERYQVSVLIKTLVNTENVWLNSKQKQHHKSVVTVYIYTVEESWSLWYIFEISHVKKLDLFLCIPNNKHHVKNVHAANPFINIYTYSTNT